MLIDATTQVRDLALQDTRIREALEHLGIDTCCGGGRLVQDAAREAGVSLEEVRHALEKALQRKVPARTLVSNWQKAGSCELIDFILRTHHVYLREKLPLLDEQLGKAIRAHGERHGAMLAGLRNIFSTLRTDLEQHLPKEETVLFPYICALEKQSSGSPAPAAPFDDIRHPIDQMEREHEAAGRALLDMRTLTDGYTLPPDACFTFASLYEGLRDLERDLHEHVFLENNILFPKALRLAPRSRC